LAASKENGLAQVRDLTGETAMTIFPAASATPLRAGTLKEADWNRLTGLLQQQWASRYEDTSAEKPRAANVAGREVRIVEGTARLGCTPMYFRNIVVVGEGIAYLVSLTSADRPVAEDQVIADRLPGSLRIGAPEGHLAMAVKGDRFESAAYGFELQRPGATWKVPTQRSGPTTTLELVRQDLAAVAVVRILTKRPGQSFKDFVADQADLASDNLTVGKPQIQPATLGGRDGLEVSYEGKLLSDQPARCTAVYTELAGRVFALFLMARKDADEAAGKELDRIRGSVKFAKAAAAR
jgi:hypothetical protein